jgi:hypothetical protein
MNGEDTMVVAISRQLLGELIGHAANVLQLVEGDVPPVKLREQVCYRELLSLVREFQSGVLSWEEGPR